MPTGPEQRRRTERAMEALLMCRLCPRECGVDRLSGKTGFCGLTAEARCFREVLHYGEEKELCPSHQIYFSGCNLRCEFCAVGEWNEKPLAARATDGEALRRCILRRKERGSRNLNILGGEPTCSLPGILAAIGGSRAGLPVVWNSNMYFRPAAAELLEGFVDLYLADWKTGNAECARRMLGAADYVQVVRANLHFARRTADLIVRHVVMPGHAKCCLEPVLRGLKEDFPGVRVSLRGDYLPPAQARSAPAGGLAPAEFAAALERAKALGLRLIA